MNRYKKLLSVLLSAAMTLGVVSSTSHLYADEVDSAQTEETQDVSNDSIESTQTEDVSNSQTVDSNDTVHMKDAKEDVQQFEDNASQQVNTENEDEFGFKKAQFFLRLDANNKASQERTMQHDASYYTPHFQMQGLIKSNVTEYSEDLQSNLVQAPTEREWKGVAK